MINLSYARDLIYACLSTFVSQDPCAFFGPIFPDFNKSTVYIYEPPRSIYNHSPTIKQTPETDKLAGLLKIAAKDKSKLP